MYRDADKREREREAFSAKVLGAALMALLFSPLLSFLMSLYLPAPYYEYIALYIYVKLMRTQLQKAQWWISLSRNIAQSLYNNTQFVRELTIVCHWYIYATSPRGSKVYVCTLYTLCTCALVVVTYIYAGKVVRLRDDQSQNQFQSWVVGWGLNRRKRVEFPSRSN